MSIPEKENEKNNTMALVPKNFDNNECAICLGPQVDKSRPDCGHVFCFQCLVDWSRIKLQCPTCKQPFVTFIHDIQSTTQHQVYTPETPVQEAPDGYVFTIINAPPYFLDLMNDGNFRDAFMDWINTNVERS